MEAELSSCGMTSYIKKFDFWLMIMPDKTYPPCHCDDCLAERSKSGTTYAAAILYSNGDIKERSFFGDKYSISETLRYLVQKWNAKLRMRKQFGVLPDELEKKLASCCKTGSFKHLYFYKKDRMICCQVETLTGKNHDIKAETFTKALSLGLDLVAKLSLSPT